MYLKLGDRYHIPPWEVKNWPSDEFHRLLDLMALDAKFEKAFPLTSETSGG